MTRRIARDALVLLVALTAATACGTEEEELRAVETKGRAPAGAAGASAQKDIEPRVGATIKVGPRAQTNALLFAAGGVWVGTHEANSGRVFRIDPATNEVVATIPLEAVPTWETGGDGMAAGAGAVWVTGWGWREDEGALQRIDPSTNEVVATISLGGRSGADVAVAETGVWVSAFGHGSEVKVVRVDPATNRVVATIPVEGEWVREIFALGSTVFVRSLTWEGSMISTTLTVIDAASNEVVASRRTEQWRGPLGEWDGVIWAGAGRELLQIDPHTAELVGEPIFVGKGIGGWSLIGGEGGVWFVGYEPDDESVPATVDRLNAVTGEVDLSVDPPERPIAMAMATGSIWLLNYEGSVTRIDLR